MRESRSRILLAALCLLIGFLAGIAIESKAGFLSHFQFYIVDKGLLRVDLRSGDAWYVPIDDTSRYPPIGWERYKSK